MSNRCFIVSGDGRVTETQPGLAPLPEINGQLNESVSSGLLYQHGSGCAIRTSELGPNGYLAAHRSPGTVCIQVLEGSGMTGLVSDGGETSCEVSLSAGDLIVFEEPMPLHFYRAGEAGLRYIAVSFPAAGK